jgi:hypothetical protein
MSPDEMINDLENRIAAARNEAELFLRDCGEVLSSRGLADFSSLPERFTARRRVVPGTSMIHSFA